LAIFKEGSAAEREKKGDELVKIVEKEVEPLLGEARPFFGGREVCDSGISIHRLLLLFSARFLSLSLFFSSLTHRMTPQN